MLAVSGATTENTTERPVDTREHPSLVTALIPVQRDLVDVVAFALTLSNAKHDVQHV